MYRCTATFLILSCLASFHPLENCCLGQEFEASVNGIKISKQLVEAETNQLTRNLKLAPARRAQIREATLTQLINQATILDFLDRANEADESELRIRIEQIKNELAETEQTLESRLKEKNISLEDFKFQLSWQIAWKKYLQDKFTNENLEKHFQAHRRKFDGTELRVAHILWQPGSELTPDEQLEIANNVRKKLIAGTLSWKDATLQHSQAPTRESEGQLGWIGVDGPMPKQFTQAAFELDLGEFSEPVRTRFGLHLILCLEVKDGTYGWRDVEAKVRRHATMTLFNSIVANHRSKIKIERN